MVKPQDVHAILGRHLLVDGFDFVVDLEHSRGCWIVDERDGTRYLDLFSFFASAALGMNHPALADDPEFVSHIGRIAVNKPSNSDVYTTVLARFVQTFVRVVGDPDLPRLFLIEGGGLAVENALKTAFDWKSRRNEEAGRGQHLGTKVLHLTHAFHGRTGYTMSLTNTEPVKVARFPKFDWPRIDVPAIRFPLEEHRAGVEAAEDHALEQARAAFTAHPHDIACFLAEPIQGEGGDNHMRAEFLQAMQALCHEHDALFVLDEVQTGMGMTGTNWACQQLGLEPDIVAFGKKTQVCGIMAGRRVDLVKDNVFTVPSRLNSTWGGNLTDMVRCQRVLEVIEADGLVERAATLGKQLLADLEQVQADFPDLVSNARGRGLMCAIDLPSTEQRNEALARLLAEERIAILGSGDRSLRFRPALVVTEDELGHALAAVRRVLERMRE
jgi:L-lysine 6-transaminase